MAAEADGVASVGREQRIKTVLFAVVLLVVYVPSRFFVLFYVKPAGNDTEFYARHAYIRRLAAERGVPFHGLYREMGLAEAAGLDTAVFRVFDSTAVAAALSIVHYPPLAVAAMGVPALGMERGCSGMAGFTKQYVTRFRWWCAAAETVTVAVAGLMILALFRQEKTARLMFRASVLCLAGLLMPGILFNRLDVITGMLLMVSIALLVKRAWFLSFIVFSLAVNFKLIPLFLVPVWALGSLRAADCREDARHYGVVRTMRAAVLRGALLCAFVACVALFFYLLEGKGAFDYVGFHLKRGVHIESMWGVFSLLAARLSGISCGISWFGSFNVEGPAAPLLAALSLPLTALLLIAATVVLAVRVARRQGEQDAGAVIEASLLFLCIVFLFSKVLSPQYLVVCIPLVALLPYTGTGAFVVTCLFFGACVPRRLFIPVFTGKSCTDRDGSVSSFLPHGY
jgi:hypothetical protein